MKYRGKMQNTLDHYSDSVNQTSRDGEASAFYMLFKDQSTPPEALNLSHDSLRLLYREPSFFSQQGTY